ncbi:hypothetical protein RSSM_05308 [Rhodopirellula sallentina SM41]|uniref:Nitroreductase n=2 Tax=Rhodopirellula TaxID=265488 RepID=M5TVN3_9BACT|nr:hypothetical protein RSSM_05308 [Rhodopirellula sallentina SM41]
MFSSSISTNSIHCDTFPLISSEFECGSFCKEIDSDVFKSLIEAACSAPSADNNQPWKFSTSNSGIDVYCDLRRRLPSDVDGMFDLLSLGAVIENICLSLARISQGARVRLADANNDSFSQADEPIRHVATIEFTDQTAENSEHGLADFIASRCTTRTPFSSAIIPSDQLAQISSAAICDPQIHLHWENEPARIRKVASMIALSDSLRFRYRDFHEELHRQLRLTRNHAEQTRDGLDYRTLGLPPGAKCVLRLLRPWRTMAFLNQLGMASLLSLPSIRLVRCSGAIGFVFVKDRTPESMIAGGRALQRIWLQATKMNLAFQPLGSLPIFLANESMPRELQPTVDRVRAKADALLPSTEGFLQMAFRIGNTKHSTNTRSLRRTAEEVTFLANPTK